MRRYRKPLVLGCIIIIHRLTLSRTVYTLVYRPAPGRVAAYDTA